MADPQEETVGEAVGERRQEKEAIPISQNDVVKENGELPESLAEIGAKEKEDHTLNSTAPATGNGEPAVTSSEGANDTNRPSPPPQESSLSDGVKEGGQVQGVTPVRPTEEEHGSSTMHSIQETFLSFVGLGSKPSGEKAHSPDVPRAEEEGGTKSEEAEKVPRVIDGVPQSTETESTEIPQKGQTEETAETGGHMQTKMEEGLEGIPKFAEETPNSVDGPKTEVERGTIEQVDTAKTDDALQTQGGETEVLRKSTETNEPQAGAVSEAEIAKSEEKGDEAQGVEVAERNIPTSTPDINEAHEPSGAEVAIFKADGTTERVGEGKSPKASKVIAPFYKAVAKVAEVVEKAVSKEGNSAAGAGQATPPAEDSVEPRRIEEGINSQEVVAAPPPTPVEQEQPTVEADDTSQPKSFFGVVLKRVEPNGKLSTESSSMGNHNSSNAEGSDNVDKSPEEAHEKEYVAPLPAAITEEETISGDAAPSDVSQGKEAAQTEADEARNVEAKSDPTTSSGTPAVPEAVSTELPKNSATGTADFAEDGTVVDSTQLTGVSAPAVVEKETPPAVVSREFPGGASEEGNSPKASKVVAPFYKVVAKVAEVVERNSATGTADFAEDGTVVDSTKETGVSAPAVEEKETTPAVVSRDFPGGASEEGNSPKASKVVAPFYKVVAKVAEVVERNSATGTADFAEDGTVVDSTKETGVSAPAVEEKETPPAVVSREFPGGASEEAKSPKASGVVAPFYKVVAKVAEVVERNSATGTADFAEDGTVVDSTKETGVSAPAVEEKETPPAVVSREFPGGASEEAKSPKASGVVAPFYKVVAKVAEVAENTVSPEEQGKIPNETNQEEKPEEDGSALEKQPSLSVNIPKQGEAAAADAETPGEETSEDLTTPRGTPLMQRVEHLEQKLAQLESRQSPRSDFASRQSTPRSSVDRPFKFSTRYILEETGSKGTLVDRVAALEQKLAHINLHPQSPGNGQSTPSISTLAENSSTGVDSKPAESQTPEWSPSAAEDDKVPEQVKSEEAAKATEDPLNPSVQENAPKDLPAQAQPVAPQKTSRSNSLSEKKVKAKAAAGKIKGLFSGCFHPKKGKTAS